ncbi:MAG TPA: ADP-ribosylation factor-like protein [Candidatus Deferrimicrobium sp.]|nr:ADP-ribosylation factor-like protein [Candidatus Deferrimicrobium sp.]
MAEETNDKNIKKILLLGLDNSGKTSILLSLTRDTNLMSYYSLTPTKGLNIKNYSDGMTTFNLWDFGGQEQYRKEYLKNLQEYLNADKIIFVIDVQDIERYDLAFAYLKEIVKVLQTIKNRPEVSIFFHKFDPGLEKKEDFTEEKIHSRLIAKIKAIFPSDFPYEIFETTIYTIFQKKVVFKL